MKRYFKCEIKIVSRWQQVTVNKWDTESFKQLIHSGTKKQSGSSETQNSIVSVFGMIFVGEKEQKQEIWCLKRKSLNINLLILYNSSKTITFLIMLIFEEKMALFVWF